jgi:hypothetical protein
VLENNNSMDMVIWKMLSQSEVPLVACRFLLNLYSWRALSGGSVGVLREWASEAASPA